jgi:hypothetical protein
MANNPNVEYAREFGNGSECLTYVRIVAGLIRMAVILGRSAQLPCDQCAATEERSYANECTIRLECELRRNACFPAGRMIRYGNRDRRVM